LRLVRVIAERKAEREVLQFGRSIFGGRLTRVKKKNEENSQSEGNALPSEFYTGTDQRSVRPQSNARIIMVIREERKGNLKRKAK